MIETTDPTAGERGATSGPERLRRQYADHAAPLLRTARALTTSSAEAEDVVHDAFLRLERASSPPRPEAERAYLRRTVVNLLTDRHRRRLAAPAPPLPGVVASAEAGAVEAMAARRVGEAVLSLPPRQRDCIVLHYFAGLSGPEVAAELGIGPGSVKTHLSRARVALAPLLEDLR